MEYCGLYLGREKIGDVSCEHVAHGLRVRGECPYAAGWIYRMVIERPQGLQPLGVMMPNGNRFVLEREISGEEVPQRAWIDRTLPGEEHLPELPLAFSAFEGNATGVLSAFWREDAYLLLPLQPGEACAMPHLLCLAQPIIHRERIYGVVCRRGETYLPLSDILRTEPVLW